MFEQNSTTNDLMDIGVMFSKYFKKIQIRNKSSMQKADALDFLIKKPDSTMSELANHLNSTQPAITNLMESMLQKGFVQKFTDTKDKRVTRLRVSEQGKLELYKIRELMGKEMRLIFEVLSEQEMGFYIKIQKKLVKQMRILLSTTL